MQTIDTSVQTTSHFVRTLPFRKQLLKRRCEISHSLRFLEWYYLSGISVNRTETQRPHGCQANATPAQWCDAPGRRLVPISSKSVHHNPRLCAVGLLRGTPLDRPRIEVGLFSSTDQRARGVPIAHGAQQRLDHPADVLTLLHPQFQRMGSLFISFLRFFHERKQLFLECQRRVLGPLFLNLGHSSNTFV